MNAEKRNDGAKASISSFCFSPSDYTARSPSTTRLPNPTNETQLSQFGR
jgi:hypothetical protein